MIETTRNPTVKSACAIRISKLNYEKRFYQIIKEQYKIRQMERSTKMDSVKHACRERIKQLMVELESLDLEKGKLEMQTSEGTEKQWYQRATQYVNANNVEWSSQKRTGQHLQYQQGSSMTHQQFPHHQHQDGFDYIHTHHHRQAPQQQIHSSPPTDFHIQPSYNEYNVTNSIQPKRGQRLPLAKPTKKKEGFDKFMSYIAP
jgi:hypothetical protein